ncbi:ExbD/TolR family protein [Rhodovulum sulfidophilum]|uniref:ExbD/TolR family protein n=1 Tax=Rhodovulum sulfidophilum TaxID=35806 RepID=UPI001912DE79|nr:biopolymer transporter ExbD [Rhodovulum sulfidophilum]
MFTFGEDDRQGTRGESIVPMINVVFLLLIFFLMSARLVPPAPFEAEPPRADGAEPAAGEMLHLSASGDLAFGAARGSDGGADRTASVGRSGRGSGRSARAGSGSALILSGRSGGSGRSASGRIAASLGRAGTGAKARSGVAAGSLSGGTSGAGRSTGAACIAGASVQSSASLA